MTFQISETDLWYGVQPLSEIRWPKPRSATKTLSATVNPASRRVWRDTRNGITVDVGYPHTYSLDPYRFGLTFAPVFDIRSTRALTLDEWRDEWIAPLVDLASLATKQPQTLSWLGVQHGEGRDARTGTVFTGGIHQAPWWRVRMSADFIPRTPRTHMRKGREPAQAGRRGGAWTR